MSAKDIREIRSALRAEGFDCEVRARKNHLQVFVGNELAFTRSRGSRSSRSHDTRNGERLRNAIRHLKAKETA